MNRREVFGSTIKSIVGAFAVGACLPESSQPKDIGREKLFAAIHELPASPIKTMLLEKVESYYKIPPLQTVSRAGVDFKLHKPSVVYRKHTRPQFSGAFDPRPEISPNVLTAVEAKRVTLPLVGLVLEHEVDKLEPAYIAPDRTFIYPFQISSGNKIDETISPTITVTVPDSIVQGITAAQLRDGEQFLFVKETCALLLDDIWMSQVVRKMQEMQVPIFVSARNRNGELVRANILPELHAVIAGNKGRLLAAMDLGSYFLAFQAMRGSSMEQNARKTLFPNKAVMSAQRVTLPSSEEGIVAASFQWAITTPETVDLDYRGELNKLP